MALPIFHVLVSGAYLAGYCAGFGGRIEQFLKVDDLFRIALGDLVKVYLVGALLPLVLLAARHASSRPYFHSHIDPMPEGPAKATAMAAARAQAGMLRRIVLATLSLLTVATAIGSIVAGGPIWAAYWLMTGGWIVVGSVELGGSLGVPPVALELIQIVVSSVAAAFFWGATIGQTERGFDFWEASARSSRCENTALLRSLGDSYLAVKLDGGKVILSGECKARFAVPTPAPRPPRLNPFS